MLDMVAECGDLVLASSEMTKGRLDTGLVVLVAILSSAELAGEHAALRVSLLVQLSEVGLRLSRIIDMRS
jgi:hypothetical protein